MEQYYCKVLKKRAFGGIVKNIRITEGKTRIREYLECKKKSEFYMRLREEVGRDGQEMEKIRKITLTRNFRNLMRRVSEEMTFREAEETVSKKMIMREKCEAFLKFTLNSGNKTVMTAKF